MDTRIKHLAGTVKAQRQTVLCGLTLCLSAILIIYSTYDYVQFYKRSRAQESIPANPRPRTPLNLPTALAQSATATPNNNDKIRQSEHSPLNLIVNGVIASTMKNRSQAIITVNNKTEIYNFGDYIEDLPGVFITAIGSNGIIINNHGDLQPFILIDSPELSLSAPPLSESPEKDDIYLDDLLITHLVYQQEALQGIRLNIRPDADGSLAEGLKPGDLAIKMNNYSLTRKESAEAAIQALASLRTAQFTVVRNGQEELVNVSTNTRDNEKDK